ncbi:MAG: ATP-binding protein [Candidatus Omnitrophota bacterium]
MSLTNIFNLHSYSLNPYAIAPFLVASLTLILGFFLYFLERRSPLNRSLLYFCVAAAVWLYSCVLILTAKEIPAAFFWSRFLFAGFVMVPAALFHISAVLPGQYFKQKTLVISVYLLAGLFAVVSQQASVLAGVKSCYFGYYPKAGALQFPSLIFFLACLIGSLINLIAYQFSLSDREEKRRMQLFIICFFSIAVSSIDILAAHEFYLYPSGFIAFFGFIIGMACFKLMFFYSTIEGHAEMLEMEVGNKTREITRVLDELRATQFKLLETGKLSALASFSAGVMHQISQPITAIHGFIRFVKKEMKETDPFYKPICHIEEQSVYLKDMLEDLMNVIRHRKIVKQDMDVNVSIKRAMNLLTDELRIRRIAWDLELGKDLPSVHADSIHLQQIFMNVVINSLQALSLLPRGKDRYLKVGSYFDEPSKVVRIFFQDTGSGLTPEEKQIIFEPFFSTKTKGAGIGLALSKDLITEHGGSIGVESEQGKGSKFIISLPVSGAET